MAGALDTVLGAWRSFAMRFSAVCFGCSPRDSKMRVLAQTTTFTTFVACQRSR